MPVGTEDLKFRVLAQVAGQEALTSLRNSVKNLETTTNQAKEAFKLLGGFLGAKEAIDYGKGLLEAGDSLAKLSQKTGASVEQLSKLREQAELADFPFDALTTGLKKLSVNLIEAVNGNAEMSGAFKKLGISARDTNGNVKTAGDVLEQLQAKFEKMKDGPEKAAIAVKLFGKSGADMIPLLNGASTEVSRLAYALDTDFASRAERFNDTLKLISNNLKAGAVEGLKVMLPTLQELADGFKELSASKSDSIGLFQGLSEAARILSLGLVTVYTALKEVIDTSITGFKEIWALIKGNDSEILRLSKALDDRTAKRMADLTDFTNRVTRNSILFGQGPSSEIEARQRAATASDEKKAGSRIDATGLGSGAKVIADFQDKLDKMKAETESYGQSNAAKERAVLLAELESKNLDRNSAAYKTLAAQITTVTEARETAKDKEKAKEYLDNQMQEIELQRLQLNQSTMARAEYEKMIETQRTEIEVTKQTKGMTEEGAQAYREAAEAARDQKLALIDLEEQQRRTWTTGAKSAFAEYVDNARNVAAQTKQLFMNAFQNMEDSLVSFVKTGKLDFHKFADDLITDIIRIQVRAAMAQAVIGVGSLFSSGVSAASAGGAADAVSSGSSVAFAANGGIMSSRGMLPLNKYARGGVANSPQLAVFGEGSMNEAYVPLPDGRSIPVTMKANGGGSVNVTVNVNMETGSPDNNASGTKAGELGRMIAAAVRNELVSQKRPGGILA